MRVGLWLLPVAGLVLACSRTLQTVPSPSPTTQVWAPDGGDSISVMLPTPRTFVVSQSVKEQYDKTTDQTTISVVVQSQQYSITKKRPGAKFFFTFSGETRQHVPATVSLEVHTTEPQEFQGRDGSYTAGTEAITFANPVFSTYSSNFGEDVILTYQISITDYSTMLDATQGSLKAGGFDIPLGEGEVEGMRELGSRMWSGD